MNFEKLKEILKNKRNMKIAGTVAGALVIAIAGSVVLYNKFNVENKAEDNKVVAVNKEESSKEETEAIEKLENLKKIDISKLSVNDMENKMIVWINNYIDKLKADGKVLSLKKLKVKNNKE